MIVRGALLILALLLVLAVMKRWRRHRVFGRTPARRVESARKCPGCGAWLVGDAACTRPGCAER